MKKISLLPVLLALAVATQTIAALESAKLDPDNSMPQFPQRLVLDGVTEGRVVFVVSISAEGKLTDSLVLAYTHEPFVKACFEVMKSWKAKPARFDGEKVPVQTELEFYFKREGVVETNSFNIMKHYLMARSGREDQLAYCLPRRDELDRAPARIKTVEPAYATEAEKQGVRGKVQVRFYIDEKGEVRLPSVTTDAHPYLSDLAVTALRQWHFEPALRRGQPVLVAASQEFDFGGAK